MSRALLLSFARCIAAGCDARTLGVIATTAATRPAGRTAKECLAAVPWDKKGPETILLGCTLKEVKDHLGPSAHTHSGPDLSWYYDTPNDKTPAGGSRTVGVRFRGGVVVAIWEAI